MIGGAVGSVTCRFMTSTNSRGGGSATNHGGRRLSQEGFTPEDIANTKTGQVLTQADGAKVFLKDLRNGKFNVIVEGDAGIITAMKGLTKREVRNLARNNGWY